MIYLLALVTLVSIGQLFLLAYALVRVRDRVRDVECAVRSFVSPGGESGEKPSPLAETTDQIAQVFAARIGSTVMASLRGAVGGTMKGANGEELASVASTPTGALASALAPAAFRKLGRNPLVMAALERLFSQLVPGDGHTTQRPRSGQRSFDL